ncbi:MAG: CIA30 family protein [Treponema sp.]|jgi:hypothetical protein|nr:CIA30 family protein [Treponema sp.]
MKKGLILTGMLALALVFGMTVVGCEEEDERITIDGWTWWVWDDSGDSGTSTIAMTQDGKKLTFSGNIAKIKGKDYGFAGCTAEPDDVNLAALKKASSISFKCKGDGKFYVVEVKTSDVTDHCYYLCTVEIPKTEKTIEVSFDDLEQPGWGKQVSFKKSNITGIQLQATMGTTGAGAFRYTVWDLNAK